MVTAHIQLEYVVLARVVEVLEQGYVVVVHTHYDSSRPSTCGGVTTAKLLMAGVRTYMYVLEYVLERTVLTGTRVRTHVRTTQGPGSAYFHRQVRGDRSSVDT